MFCTFTGEVLSRGNLTFQLQAKKGLPLTLPKSVTMPRLQIRGPGAQEMFN